MDLVVPYEDEHLLVVDKPAGSRRASGAGPRDAARSCTACSRTTSRAATSPTGPGIVHRLDRDTSGLLVVARSPEAHRRLQELVQRARLTREYLALVVGRPRSRTRHDRRADRPRPQRRAAALARHRHAARCRDALRGRGAPARGMRCCASRSRRGGRIRSACISQRSTCRSPATPSTGGRASSASSASSSMPRGSRSSIRSRARASTSSPRRCRSRRCAAALRLNALPLDFPRPVPLPGGYTPGRGAGL